LRIGVIKTEIEIMHLDFLKRDHACTYQHAKIHVVIIDMKRFGTASEKLN
jgi:hypothetical protein